MAGVGQHHGNHLPANPFPAAVGEPRDIAAFPVPSGHPLQLPPLHPAPQHSHANAPRDNPVRNRHFGVLFVTGSWDRVWEHPMDRGKFGEPAQTLTYVTF